ncbi:MAG: intradiol ring-cleavage dioxygenase, partial [Phycisphaerales bacterium]|nr:intradiol ring-cleavage dioxygenase [Phycisphaerales bacterium]
AAIDGPDGAQGMPAELRWNDTSPAWNLPGQKLLLTGTIYQPDGRTPASEVILYYYQTNTEGRYQHRPDEPRSMPPNELGQTHGFIRGWVRTGPDGRYAISTTRPGAYPTRDAPAHVHATITEPGGATYYIDDWVFDDDPLLTSAARGRLENRGGSGVVRLARRGDLLVGERDIVLARNIPGHAAAQPDTVPSGRAIGDDVPSFIPFHAWGPDRGTRACPVCKYGWYHGILYFVGTDPDWSEVRAWLAFLEAESARRPDRLKVYFVYGNPRGYAEPVRRRELEALGAGLGLERVALTFVPSLTDRESEVNLNRINPRLASTFIVYRRTRIIGKAADLAPTPGNFRWITDQLDRTANEYFDLPKAPAPEAP